MFLVLSSCSHQDVVDNRQAQIDSLKHQIELLKPGLGEFMIQFEYHHDRLGNAIRKQDFARAAYEIDELKETAERIQALQITNDKLQKPFPIFFEKYLKSPFDVLASAAEKKDNVTLQNNFIALTNNCNSCHHENNVEPFANP